MNTKINSKIEDKDLQKDFDELFNYLKNVLSLNKTLASAFMGITLTAFIFLISLGYPDILEELLIIGGLSIKVVQSSLSVLVLSFFFFLGSTFLYHYCELKLYSLYFYYDPELTLSDRYEKSEKLFNIYYTIAFACLIYGVMSLIAAVIFVFLYFASGGIILAIAMLILFVIVLGSMYISHRIKRRLAKKEKG